ncbi:MAG TPA: GvpL/GvpF family gas vesicle protein, partial [Rhodopila sp.]|nr:GvpL/GvpF family gas vesicle protein [Rhodopila sp.]
MTAQSARAWYAYAILADTPDLSCVDGVLSDAPVEPIRVGALTVLVSLVPRAVFDSADPASKAADPDWAAARIAAHHAVNVAAAEAGPSLPLTFGVLFSSLDVLREWVAPRSMALQAALAHVSGRCEWSVSMRADPTTLAMWLDQHTAAIQSLMQAGATAGQGAGFLISRRLAKARAAARTTYLQAVADMVARQLEDLGAAVMPEPPKASLPQWTVLVPYSAVPP